MPRPVLAILTALAVLVAVGVVGVAVAAVQAWQGQPSAAAGRRTPSSPGSPTPPRATSTPVPTPTRPPTPTPRPALRVVGLGDSVPAADACGCDGYLEQLVPALRATTGRQVTLANDATGGWTTQDVVNDLAGHRPPPIAMWVFASRQDSLAYPTTARFLAAARPPLSVSATIVKVGGHRTAIYDPYVKPALQWLATTLPGFRP